MGVRFQTLVNLEAAAATANTDIFTDVVIAHDGLLHIAFETLAAEDVRIALNGTNFTTLKDTAADIWNTNITIPCGSGDTLQMQCVGNETISIKIVLESSNERD